MHHTPRPSEPLQRCKIKRVTHAPSAPCPLRGGRTTWTIPTPCHTRTRAENLGAVSGRSVWNASQIQIRLRDGLTPCAWTRLSTAANRAGTDVERPLQQHLVEAR
jgi:hypothetical protein